MLPSDSACKDPWIHRHPPTLPRARKGAGDAGGGNSCRVVQGVGRVGGLSALHISSGERAASEDLVRLVSLVVMVVRLGVVVVVVRGVGVVDVQRKDANTRMHRSSEIHECKRKASDKVQVQQEEEAQDDKVR